MSIVSRQIQVIYRALYCDFTPIAFKFCAVIFSPMRSGWVGVDRQENFYQGYTSEVIKNRKFILGDDIGWQCRYAMTFDLGSARTDYSMYFYLIFLSPLATTFQLINKSINFTTSELLVCKLMPCSCY